MATRYSVVVESGNCSPDYHRWEERENCGHHHKSIQAAVACMTRLTRWYCMHSRVAGTLCAACGGYAHQDTTSARWYNARLHHADGSRLTEEEEAKTQGTRRQIL